MEKRTPESVPEKSWTLVYMTSTDGEETQGEAKAALRKWIKQWRGYEVERIDKPELYEGDPDKTSGKELIGFIGLGESVRILLADA